VFEQRFSNCFPVYESRAPQLLCKNICGTFHCFEMIWMLDAELIL